MTKKSTLILFFLVICCDIIVLAKKQDPNLIFNGDGIVVLALSKPLKVDILQTDTKNPATFLLPDKTNASSITGSKSGSNFKLEIVYDKEIAGNDGKLTKAQLTFDISFDAITGYWTLKSLKSSYTGTINNKAIAIDESLDVDSNPGKTHSPADQICGRGYLTCAPKNLCWACDNQIFKGSKSRLTMPGSRLQPVFSNGTSGTVKFGYEWDCDPLIPLSVWVGLLLTLVLVTFLYWAIDMLVSLQTPNRFDDPRGKPLNVPASD